MTEVLSEHEVAAFVRDGFVRLAGAFPRETADACREFLWREAGLSPDDPAGWTQPVVRLPGSAAEPFQQAATTPRLHAAFDQLVGEGSWLPRVGLGTFPIRFPHPDDPGDAGWHIDGGYALADGAGLGVNLRSRGRALLMLFLFSDVGPDDAPTRIKVGSHLDVPRFLAPHGDAGVDLFEMCGEMDRAGLLGGSPRPVALATGAAGDVYLCHPFLVHAAQPHRGTVPRFIAQPPLYPCGELELDRADGAFSPVEQAVRLALGTE